MLYQDNLNLNFVEGPVDPEKYGDLVTRFFP